MELQPHELTVFAGEQLAFLSSGRIPAALHRVPAPNTHGRFAMPFFVRAHPGALLSPMPAEVHDGSLGACDEDAEGVSAGAPDGLGDGHDLDHVAVVARPPARCEEFVLHELFRRRPWRSALVPGTIPDY